MRRLVLSVLVALPLTSAVPQPGLGAPSRTAAAAAAAEPCSDALVVSVTGAGEGDAATGEPGVTLGIVADAVGSRVAARGRSVETRVVSADTAGPRALQGRGTRRTPAEKAVTRTAWRAWRSPVGGLVSGLTATLEEALAGCPDTLVHLLGHSQGAEAVHRFLAGRADADLASRTVGVVLVADPARVAGSTGPITGTPAAPRTAEGVSARLARRAAPAVPRDDWQAPVHSVCTAGDLVCDLGPTPVGRAVRIHASYADDAAGRLAAVGREYGDRTALWPLPAEGQVVQGQVGLLLQDRLRVSVARKARDDLRWAAASPVPPGLTLTSRGVLRGTPTEAGTWTVDYTVRNTGSRALDRPVSGQVTVTVDPPARSEVSAGGRHTCEIRTDGTLWCWGANFYGQLGTGDTVGGPTPRQVGSHDDWADVSAGGMHTCAVRDNGTLWCWGLNYRGQLGLDSRQDRAEPRRVGDARDWASVSAGWVHTCAVRQDGTAGCWGDNDHGQLGNGRRVDAWTPTPVSRDLRWSQVSAGGWHTCGVTRGGAAYCWGRNVKGQLGDGTVVMRTNPARVGADTDWVSLAPAWTHTCGLRRGGQLSCWGGNEGGQLGEEKFGGTTTPKPLGADRAWATVHTGTNFSCALDTEQALWCWGTGRTGQLGGPTRSEQPVRVMPERTWSQVDLGWLFGCGLAGDPAPTCWGNNETGELGSPTTTRPRSAARRAGVRFNLVTFNVLGSNHTAPRTDAAEYTPARVRTEWMIDYLRSIRAGVVGFQELQRDQLTWFTKGAGATYDVWPGTSQDGEGLQTTIAWNTSVWEFVEGDTVAIPFITQTRHMPLVRLEHRGTGRRIWVMNVHNAPQDFQDQRNTALRREIRRLKDVVGNGEPVFLIGDFNERHRAFCEVTGKLPLVAPRGGSHQGGDCNPPQGSLRVDWIFGSRDVDFGGYTEDKSPLVRLMTDHAVLRTRVTVP